MMKQAAHASSGHANWLLPMLMMVLAHNACANPPKDYTLYSGLGNDEAEGPWDRFPGVPLSRGDLTQNNPSGLLPIKVLEAMAGGLLSLDGATQCDSADPVSRKPMPNISAEYCSAAYVVNTAQDERAPSYELRLTIPRRNLLNPESGCVPPKVAVDRDFPARWVTIIGLLHNHPCWRGPSSLDMGTWPVDYDFSRGMARLDLYPGNVVTGSPPIIDGTPLIVQSYILVRKGRQPIYLLLRTTGDVHQWNGGEWEWRAKCEPASRRNRPAICNPPFKLIGD
jgi:hypothetical protein